MARPLGPRQIVERRGARQRTSLAILFKELDELVRFWIGQRAQQDCVHHTEDCGARADAKSEGQNDRGRDDWGPAQAAPRVAKILRQHAQMFGWRGPHEIHDQTAPEAPPGFISPAIPEQPRHLTPELVAKLLRIEAQQPSIPPLARPVALHEVLRLGVRPAARAWRKSVVRRSASACATSRPTRVRP